MRAGFRSLPCLLLAAAAGQSSGAVPNTPSPAKEPTMTSTLPPVYSPDNLDGTYKNPIIHADYSDPDVIRVDDDYYLTASSFSCFPGLPILHSKDLINWTIIGHALPAYPAPAHDYFNTPKHGDGVWAPAIRFHNGAFYIYWGDPDNGIFMVRSKDPAGPWDSAVLVKQSKGWIDTCPLWDDDGNAYLVHAFARSRSGLGNILDICKMSPDGTTLLDEGTRIFQGPIPPATTPPSPYTTVEGPKFYKKNGYYFIFSPGGGVTAGYQIVFRSKNVLGPYDSRIVLEQGNTKINGPHQGGWVTTQTGEDWFLHFQDDNAYGRIVHLQPMTWKDDWPIVGTPEANNPLKGNPVLTYKKPNVGEGKTFPAASPQTSDDFHGPALGLQWQWFANFDPAWAQIQPDPSWNGALGGGGGPPNILQLTPVSLDHPAPLYQRPNLLLQKFPAETFTATTALDAKYLGKDETAGLVVVGPNTFSLTVSREADGYKITRTQFTAPRTTATNAPAPVMPPDATQESVTVTSPKITLQVKVTAGARCQFLINGDNKPAFTPLGKPFTAVKDQWIGAKLGLFANAPPNTKPTGHADFNYLHFE